jgi:ATP synthase protein I
VTGSRTPTRRGLGKPPAPGTENPGWTIFSYLLAGMIFYGGVGWVIGRWAIHSALCFPLGMVVGLALAIVLVILRFGRSGAA